MTTFAEELVALHREFVDSTKAVIDGVKTAENALCAGSIGVYANYSLLFSVMQGLADFRQELEHTISYRIEFYGHLMDPEDAYGLGCSKMEALAERAWGSEGEGYKTAFPAELLEAHQAELMALHLDVSGREFGAGFGA